METDETPKQEEIEDSGMIPVDIEPSPITEPSPADADYDVTPTCSSHYDDEASEGEPPKEPFVSKLTLEEFQIYTDTENASVAPQDDADDEQDFFYDTDSSDDDGRPEYRYTQARIACTECGERTSAVSRFAKFAKQI